MTTTIDPPVAGDRAIGPLPPLDRTLPGMLRAAARRGGPRSWVRIGSANWSHQDGPTAAAASAARLAAAGIRRGDRVALMCSNRIEFVEVFLGCGWLGAVVVPINTAAMGPQIEHVLADSGAVLLVVEAEFTTRLAQVNAARCAAWTATLVVGHERVPELGNEQVHDHERKDESEQNRQQAREGEGASVAANGPRAESYGSDQTTHLPPLEAVDILPGDPLAILYTSGTTGPAKGVIFPHGQFHWWGVNTARILGLSADDVLGTTLPLFHVNALNTLAQALMVGCGVVVEPRFSASGFWAAMGASGATVIYVLGAMVPMLLAQPASAAERTHRVRLGLGPGVPAAAMTAMAARTDVPLIEGYGSTETNFAIATSLAAPRPGTMGFVQTGFHARVVDAHDNELPAGEAGELVLRADEPFAFASGYFGLPEKTVEAWRNLWFHTGDRVLREADGAIRFIDRMKDAIRRRGENISSYEVEQALLGHPSVAVAAVFPVRSELAEDEVMAAVIAAVDKQIDPPELIAHCTPLLPRYAIPRYIDVVDDLPRTENGKVQKFKLIERGVGPQTWERPAEARTANKAPP